MLVGVAGGRAATGPAHIRITDVQVQYHVVRPRHGGVPVSMELIQQRLYNQRIASTAIGRAWMTCTYFDRRQRSCMATYILPRGSLVVSGAIQSRLLYELPIVGGTGLFDNARGTLTVTSTHLRPRREVLVFRLTG